MNNIIDYVKEFGGYTFEDRPFCEVDALILAQFSYFKWENVIPGIADNAEAVSIMDMKEKMYEAEVFSYEMYAEDNRKLWNAMLASRRFASMRCNYMSEILSEKMQTQFCAFTVFLDGVEPVIIYRGTDETILGWKEDYDMAKDAPIAGQRIASMYLRQAALRFEGGFITVGHSKGGNLAVYSVLDNTESIKDRAVAVYNFDGPHFRADILENFDYDGIADKVHKYIPQSSIVGILMETEHNYKVIYSEGLTGVLQHSPFNWIIVRGHFEYRDEVHSHSKKLNDMLISLISNMDNEQIELIGRLIFGIIESSDITTTSEFMRDRKSTRSELLRTMRTLSPEKKEQIKDIIRELIGY